MELANAAATGFCSGRGCNPFECVQTLYFSLNSSNGFHTPAATPMHNLNEWVDGGHVPVAATLAKPQGVVCWSWGCGGPSLSLPRRKDLLSHTDAVGPA
eukprot:CAMPEP_0174339834 /NCGR_PEP_ID=MMETSP0810-20121108/24216_1 /TAXON_ID=73025 ORGANISM="Eutreptiella gymnastica-like, Strain CCMP1594" /NCGR_SAMPLE_ID=MMETSP0810 /ASSEMBLY_ACC=CAM_ASM_000659 /LENGTH=98 /DNA_ID=CAMNT_0015460683 /DNA_START=377 /DNA_END=670 /DNA_ORIENTATION=+